MLDFSHIVDTPGADIKYYQGAIVGQTPSQYTWVKPRGARMVYIIAVGGAGGGGAGVATGTTSGGGGGGGAGGLATVLIPAFFVPDVLAIQVGGGGSPTANGVGGDGENTYVGLPGVYPLSSYIQAVLLRAPPGGGGFAASTTLGGSGGSGAPTLNVVSASPLASRGIAFFAGGGSGVTGPNAGIAASNTAFSSNSGLWLWGGNAGGSCNNTVSTAGGSTTAGTSIRGMGNIFPYAVNNQATSTGAVGATPATTVDAGIIGSYLGKFMLGNAPAAGGGGATTTAGGSAAAGGDGAPGCGGGGGGGANTTNTFSIGGKGGPGFVYIVTTL